MNKADVVEVWGYSLPESDQAVRALVAPLIDRLEHSKVSVIVHDPDFEARERWKKFLGSASITHDSCAELREVGSEAEAAATR